MRKIVYKKSIEKDMQLMWRRGKSMQKIKDMIALLANDLTLPPALKDHQLKWGYAGFRECHIEPDWLLIYKKEDSDADQWVLFLEATGTHSDLFG